MGFLSLCVTVLLSCIRKSCWNNTTLCLILTAGHTVAVTFQPCFECVRLFVCVHSLSVILNGYVHAHSQLYKNFVFTYSVSMRSFSQPIFQQHTLSFSLSFSFTLYSGALSFSHSLSLFTVLFLFYSRVFSPQWEESRHWQKRWRYYCVRIQIIHFPSITRIQQAK